MRKSNRKHTAKRPNTSLFLSFEDFDFSDFVKPYKELQEEYKRLEMERLSKGTPYVVTYTSVPDIMYLVFAKNKDKAKGIATKYFKENFHPDFVGKGWRTQHLKSRTKVIPEFKKYSQTGKVPIPDLMKILNLTFPCLCCHDHNFNYQDYENGKCYVIEDDGYDLNDFTKGYVLCRECYNIINKGK